MTHKCNSFIIRDGEFVREFEMMYQAFEDPWNQQADLDKDLFGRILLYSLQHYTNMLSTEAPCILDIGCANGFQTTDILDTFPQCSLTATDISITAIERAKKLYSHSGSVTFEQNDIILNNPAYLGKFNIIHCGRTLYYVAPEIDAVIKNIHDYLADGGLFAFSYNQTVDAFSRQYLDYELLRKKLLDSGFLETFFIEANRFSDETVALGIFRKK